MDIASHIFSNHYTSHDLCAGRFQTDGTFVDDIRHFRHPLRPQSVMPRNALCWCGSKLKWKRCHYIRQSETPFTIGQIQEINDHVERSLVRCMHPNAGDGRCLGRVINSHTVTRSLGLLQIAENSHVLSALMNLHDIGRSNGQFSPKLLGFKRASIFPGYCNPHDTHLFLPLERNFEFTHEVSLLALLRAGTMEYEKKLEQQNS